MPTEPNITYSADDTANSPPLWSGVGRPLTAQEFNGNTYDLQSRVAALEADVTTNVSIDTITQPTADTLLVTMTDTSTRGPFSLPTATFRDRGAWQPDTAYLVNDTFTANGALYRVLLDHTSAATFDPNANDGSGHDYYAAMLQNPGSSLPTGGAARANLKKSSTTDYAVTWGFDDALDVTFEPSTASALTATNVADALEELETLISGAGGSIALSSLSDVLVTEGAGIDGYYLQWNNASGKWRATAAASNLSGLADVNVTEGSGINGYFLQWNNTTGKWVAAASSASLAGLSDVNVSEGAGIDGEFLKYNNSTSKWIPSTVSLSILADVNVSEGSGIDGYFLKWNNATGKWVASLSGATAVALSGLSDVSVSEGSSIDGYRLYWNNAASKWESAGGVNTQTANYTLALSDLYGTVQANSGSAITITVPPNSSVAFPLGASIEVGTIGTGAMTIAAGAGVTVNAPFGLTSTGQYQAGRLVKVGTNTWNWQWHGRVGAVPATSGSSVQKADGNGGLTAASAGTDYGRASVDQNSQSAAYTTVLSDAGKHIYHPSTDANARTFTIDSNANVAYPIGTTLTFVNETSQAVTIAITSDTLVLAGAGTTGSRTLAQYGVATALKVGPTRWYISGSGLT